MLDRGKSPEEFLNQVEIFDWIITDQVSIWLTRDILSIYIYNIHHCQWWLDMLWLDHGVSLVLPWLDILNFLWPFIDHQRRSSYVLSHCDCIYCVTSVSQSILVLLISSVIYSVHPHQPAWFDNVLYVCIHECEWKDWKLKTEKPLVVLFMEYSDSCLVTEHRHW